MGGKGHKQKGAGAVISDKGPIERGGVTLQSYQRLPSQLIHEFCQKEKRPKPMWFSNNNQHGHFVELLLKDEKKSTKDMRFKPTVGSESNAIAKENAALLGLLALQRNLPLERKLPEPYRSTWWMSVSSNVSGLADSTSSTSTSKNTTKENATAQNKGPISQSGSSSERNDKSNGNQQKKKYGFEDKYKDLLVRSRRKRQSSNLVNP